MKTHVICEECGNKDQNKFIRYYVEETLERLVDGVWSPVEAWEFDDGAHTHTLCEVCKMSVVEDLEDKDGCDQCGDSLLDGEGYDGLCGNCADIVWGEEA